MIIGYDQLPSIHTERTNKFIQYINQSIPRFGETIAYGCLLTQDNIFVEAASAYTFHIPQAPEGIENITHDRTTQQLFLKNTFNNIEAFYGSKHMVIVVAMPLYDTTVKYVRNMLYGSNTPMLRMHAENSQNDEAAPMETISDAPIDSKIGKLTLQLAMLFS
jgi:hypothetical protein